MYLYDYLLINKTSNQLLFNKLISMYVNKILGSEEEVQAPIVPIIAPPNVDDNIAIEDILEPEVNLFESNTL